MRSGPEAVEFESLETVVVSSLVVKGEQKVLWWIDPWGMSLSIDPSVDHSWRSSLLRKVWAEVGSVDVGSVFGWLGVRKFWVAGRTLLASNSVNEVENSTGVWAGGQVVAGVSVLALEMTEDAHRDASTYARRWASERCVSERALRLSRTANSTSSDHHALRGRPRRPKGMETASISRRLNVVVWSLPSIREVGRNGETTTPRARPSGRPQSFENYSSAAWPRG